MAPADGLIWVLLLQGVATNVVLSADNVVAVAGAAEGSIAAFVVGLAASIPLIIVGAAALATVIERFPVFI